MSRSDTSQSQGQRCCARAAIAACISGQVRTLAHVTPYVLERTLRPIWEETDVFVAVDLSVRAPRSLNIRALHPCAVEYGTFSSQNDGLAVCERLILQREIQRGGAPYTWVIRQRTDFIPLLELPPFVVWPKVSARVAFVNEVRIEPGATHPCHVSDQWALMSRTASRLYHGPWIADRNKITHEQRLATTLYRAGVELFQLHYPHWIVRISENSSEGSHRAKGDPLKNASLRRSEVTAEQFAKTTYLQRFRALEVANISDARNLHCRELRGDARPSLFFSQKKWCDVKPQRPNFLQICAMPSVSAR